MDFLGSRRVLPMTIAERGAYMQLLILAWDDPCCSLPANDRELKKLALWGKRWGSFERVRACFEPHPTQAGRLYNARLYDEFRYCQEKSQAAHDSAKTRWQKVPAGSTEIRRPAKKDRELGFEPIGAVADKYFPPK